MGTEDDTAQLAALLAEAAQKLRDAEKAWYAYACEVPVGREREKAFEVFENVRTARRVGA